MKKIEIAYDTMKFSWFKIVSTYVAMQPKLFAFYHSVIATWWAYIWYM